MTSGSQTSKSRSATATLEEVQELHVIVSVLRYTAQAVVSSVKDLNYRRR